MSPDALDYLKSFLRDFDLLIQKYDLALTCGGDGEPTHQLRTALNRFQDDIIEEAARRVDKRAPGRADAIMRLASFNFGVKTDRAERWRLRAMRERASGMPRR